METFQEAGVQMLKEFRALLQHSPLPLPGTRLLQLLALNMFAIESTQLKGESSIFLFFLPLSCSSSRSLDHPLVDFPSPSTRRVFSSFPGETSRMEMESFEIRGYYRGIIHAGGRLQVWIMCYVADGIDTFADSRFEFRWIFARRSAWSFACV